MNRLQCRLILKVTYCLLCDRHCIKWFTFIHPSGEHCNVLSPSYGWRNQGPDRQRKMFQITLLGNGQVRVKSAFDQKCHTTLPLEAKKNVMTKCLHSRYTWTKCIYKMKWTHYLQVFTPFINVLWPSYRIYIGTVHPSISPFTLSQLTHLSAHPLIYLFIHMFVHPFIKWITLFCYAVFFCPLIHLTHTSTLQSSTDRA